MVVFFADTQEELLKYAGMQAPPFPVIPDPELKYFKAYGVEWSYSGMFKAMLRAGTILKMMVKGFFNLKSIRKRPIVPADFLIDEQQQVYMAWYGNDYGDHIPIDTLYNWSAPVEENYEVELTKQRSFLASNLNIW